MQFSIADATYFANTLNEVLNGFEVAHFDSEMQGSTTEAEKLRQKLNRLAKRGADEEPILLALSPHEARVLINASSRCLEEFSPEEFATRLGETVAYAKLRLDELARLS